MYRAHSGDATPCRMTGVILQLRSSYTGLYPQTHYAVCRAHCHAPPSSTENTLLWRESDSLVHFTRMDLFEISIYHCPHLVQHGETPLGASGERRLVTCPTEAHTRPESPAVWIDSLGPRSHGLLLLLLLYYPQKGPG